MSTNNRRRDRAAGRRNARRDYVNISSEIFHDCDAEGREVGEGRRVLAVSVPIVVRHHREKPGGESLAVGEVSAGSLDLALNVLGELYPPASDGEEPRRCKVNLVSATAYRHHEDFCKEFLAPMEPDGGRIPLRRIRSWVEDRERFTKGK
ncbi:MAG: hypothetical protein L0G70_01695 [Rubrobacter sp.]|nr:hypothetical protein [Rubrobacter sp.]